jgi:hypothetical protein
VALTAGFADALTTGLAVVLAAGLATVLAAFGAGFLDLWSVGMKTPRHQRNKYSAPNHPVQVKK